MISQPEMRFFFFKSFSTVSAHCNNHMSKCIVTYHYYYLPFNRYYFCLHHSLYVWDLWSRMLKRIYLESHSGPEYLKKSRPKNLVKSNKSISRNFILTKFHFLQFQKWPKINFLTEKKFKTANNAISRKIFFDLFAFTSFWARTFLNFLARCG